MRVYAGEKLYHELQTDGPVTALGYLAGQDIDVATSAAGCHEICGIRSCSEGQSGESAGQQHANLGPLHFLSGRSEEYIRRWWLLYREFFPVHLAA